MRSIKTLFFVLAVAICGGCSFNEGSNAHLSPRRESIGAESKGDYMNKAPEKAAETIPAIAPAATPAAGQSHDSLDSAQVQTIERKIIRNADLTLELDAPEQAQRRITSIAEKHGGFVVNSESRQNDGDLQSSPKTSVTVIARVPAAKFAEAVEEIQQLAGRVLYRKDAGQDVTEEFIDLEARIRAKRALEAQFMEIMKRAQKVSEALEVQTQISEVRAEIERMEGRRRFLENQAALSTITVRLQTPAPIVAATTGGFRHGIKLAFGDGLDTAAEIVLGLIRFVIVMTPVTLLIILPGWLLIRWARRRLIWPKTAAPVSVVEQSNE
ncbi:MAG TPA: DUF4349 domain-containing protein [Blastocatellia bacterium]|nr:DUF4349 domain-containing protein [Blastocatellia bacterium]HMX27638.1 DUF4349 domain-containing protein [Blastocatellia bacterium]HMY75631.1 DUF4349 domain-containing protein [Blastocatellia bacterium]HMZ17124.1 DUF4349 domain-containing protein [Blastocatellia bacterium]HNG32626.1 DUF4349 domain-containing protein [Blastocatellia bacterium]